MVRPISYRAVYTEIYKHGDYKPHCQFHVIQYLADVLRKCRQLPLEFIAQKKLWLRTSTNKCQSHNSCWSRLVARGEKLLERNKRSGHNLRQYGKHFKCLVLGTFSGIFQLLGCWFVACTLSAAAVYDNNYIVILLLYSRPGSVIPKVPCFKFTVIYQWCWINIVKL